MTLTEYAKNNKYVIAFDIYHEKGVIWSSDWKELNSIDDLYRLKFKNDEPRLFEAIVSKKPKLTFGDIQDLIYEKFGYGYMKADDKDKLTEDQTALDIINSILANQLIQYPSFDIGEQIEITDEELEVFFDITKKVE